MTSSNLQLLLQAAAAVQVGIVIMNFCIVRLLKWEPLLENMPLLMRQVFQVHVWFISLTVAIFAAITWKFASAMSTGTDSASTWLAGSIALFWGIRALLQVTYYSSSHWRGHAGRTLIHAGCLIGYGGLSLVYLLAAVRGGSL